MLKDGIAPSELSDWLIGQGRHFISTTEAARVLDVEPESVSASLERPRQAGKLVSVTKGGWIPVPAEYRSAGSPPPTHFIHQLMEHLGHPYYVGFLSAAAICGASHQAPMVTQVATPAKLRERKVGRGRIRFIERSTAADRPRKSHNVPTGRIWVSTPEVTVFDLVEVPQEGAGLSNVATVVGDLLAEGQLDPDTLASAGAFFPKAVVQRAGYLIDFMAHETNTGFDTGPLHKLVEDTRYRALSPSGGPGHRDPRWHITANTELEHDL
ncbi:type IV toxin-antitoxin system AbiEi family antitoxin domain-containing protein [Candidatus Poriferisocius sp.]|uniref:type IV toxin-antitoxin system AbiEi family antitoxin domain-containing protein n=1 Tax=Candidatus Poriferisocius sp. TaxID=3101276 RepID=UPI003B0284B1